MMDSEITFKTDTLNVLIDNEEAGTIEYDPYYDEKIFKSNGMIDRFLAEELRIIADKIDELSK